LDLPEAFTQSTHAAMRREQIARLALIKPTFTSTNSRGGKKEGEGEEEVVYGDVDLLRHTFREFLLQAKESLDTSRG